MAAAENYSILTSIRSKWVLGFVFLSFCGTWHLHDADATLVKKVIVLISGYLAI